MKKKTNMKKKQRQPLKENYERIFGKGALTESDPYDKATPVQSVNVGTARYELGGQDPEGNKVIGIYKHPNGFEVMGREWHDENGFGDEAYSYWYDLKGNEAEEDEIVVWNTGP